MSAQTRPVERPAPAPRQTVAVFDLDGTLTKRDTGLAFLVGLLKHSPRRWYRAVWLGVAVGMFSMRWRSNSWLKGQFARHVVGGQRPEHVKRFAARFVAEVAAKGMREGGRQRLDYHLKSGHRVILCTASLDVYVPDLARLLGIEEVICTNTVRSYDGRWTGVFDGQNCYGLVKVERLETLLGGGRGECYVQAYSDHHADLPLLEWADEGFAVHPTKKLAKIAKEQGFRVVRWDDEPLVEDIVQLGKGED